jgi:hypothetical protein
MPRKKKHTVTAAPGGRAGADPVKMTRGVTKGKAGVGKLGPNANRPPRGARG